MPRDAARHLGIRGHASVAGTVPAEPPEVRPEIDVEGDHRPARPRRLDGPPHGRLGPRMPQVRAGHHERARPRHEGRIDALGPDRHVGAVLAVDHQGEPFAFSDAENREPPVDRTRRRTGILPASRHPLARSSPLPSRAPVGPGPARLSTRGRRSIVSGSASHWCRSPSRTCRRPRSPPRMAGVRPAARTDVGEVDGHARAGERDPARAVDGRDGGGGPPRTACRTR